MKQTTMRVIFRIDRSPNYNGHKEVTAILPDQSASAGHYACYAHVGQHGECAIDWYHKSTVPATEDQYASLLAELTSIYGGTYPGDPDGVKLRIVKRIARKDAVSPGLSHAAREEHYKGLAQWVADYQAARTVNMGLAKQIRDNIKEKIAQHGLDAVRVWGNDPDDAQTMLEM